MKTNYAYQNYNKENMARVLSKDISVSTKQSVEVCKWIKHKTTKKAKYLLQGVVDKKWAVPYKRYNKDIGHRKNIGVGRYPIKTSNFVLELIDMVEANAQNKGLDVDSLVIEHICAHRAARPWHFGRARRRKMKRTHIEIVVKEKDIKKEKK